MESVAKRFAGRDQLTRLLQQYNERPQDREQVVKEIEERFKQRLAIVVMDSSGFTRAVREGGIISYLAKLERLQRLVAPLIERTGGSVLKSEADNVFAVYTDAQTAVESAQAILDLVRTMNEALPEDEEIYVSMGIGFGDLLVIGSDDLFGDEMNLACKLGEDLAERDQVLLTPSAKDSLGESTLTFEDVRFSIAGVEIEAARLSV